MIRICAWCKKEQNSIPSQESHSQSTITHGICPSCCRAFLGTLKAKTWHDYLDLLPGPIIAVDADGRLLEVNSDAEKMTGKTAARLKGMLGGEAIECEYASLPGGCGKTAHCVTCAIRNTLTDTFETGKSYLKVPAYRTIHTPDGIKNMRFLISTEKVADSVLLRIDEAVEVDEVPPDFEEQVC